MKNKASVQKRVFILCILIPFVGGYALFTIYPNLLAAYYSFFQWDGFSPMQYVGLNNYARMFTDYNVWRSLYHNLKILLIVPACTLVISAVLAYLITNMDYAERHVNKVIYFIPNVISIVVIGLIWSFIYDGEFGILNAVLRLIGIDMQSFYWLGDTRTALYALMAPQIWMGVGFYVIILMNAMSSIPKTMYEAATLDGASHWTRLVKITVPLIMGVVRVSFIFLAISAIKSYEIQFVITNGAPEGSTNVIGLYMFNAAFAGRRLSGAGAINMFGYASAIGMLVFAILVVINVLVDRFSPSETDIEY